MNGAGLSGYGLGATQRELNQLAEMREENNRPAVASCWPVEEAVETVRQGGTVGDTASANVNEVEDACAAAGIETVRGSTWAGGSLWHSLAAKKS